MSSVVGRDAERAVVAEFLSANVPHLSGLTIVGDAGIGKSTLWDEAVRSARERATVVLVARPSAAEARLSYAGVTDLLSAVPTAALDELPPPQRHALDVALLRVEATQPPPQRLVGTALRSLTARLATAHDIVIAIDDVQWLDPASTAVLAFAVRRLADAPVRLVLAARTGGGRSALVDAVPPEQARRIELGPLSAAALHGIIAARVGRSLPRPVLVRIATACGGNPFYAIEIARQTEGRRIDEPLPVPRDVLEQVGSRIRSLPAASRDALLRAAAAARPDVQLVDAAALAPAEDADLVEISLDGRVAFTHPLYAGAVYSSATPPRRREAHRALARSAADPEERARHLALAGTGPDEEVARVVAAAGRLAHTRGAPDAAAELTELAVELTPPDSGARDERRLALASYLQLAGDLDRAIALLEDMASALTPGDLLARALLLRSELVYRRSGESEARRLALEAVAVAESEVVRARCQATLAGWAGTVDAAGAETAAAEAVAALEAAGADPALVSFALANLVRARLFLGAGLDAAAARRALELERASTPPPAVDDRVAYKLGQWLRYVDDLAGAREHLIEVERAAQEEGDEASLVNILINRLQCELWAGDWAGAARCADRLEVVAAQLGVADASRVWRAYLDAHLGRLAAIGEASAAMDGREPVTDMLLLRARGIVELAADRVEDANGHLGRAIDLIVEMGMREPAIWRVEAEAVEAAAAAGDLARAESVLARLERSSVPWSRSVWHRGRGLLAAARGDLDAALVELRAALVEHEQSPVPFERARTLLALGRVHRRLKHKRLAHEALREALELFDGLGASLWSDRAREELARVTTRRAAATLTPTEHEIARLAASGLTNRAIAERAFVSQKTVEANLARAYRKLGIGSRAQLARALDRDGSHPAADLL
jgi:DNA-binding CsgD family transcriptional regulator